MALYSLGLLQMGSADGTPTDEFGEDIRRLFVPSVSTMHGRVPESQLITYNAGKQVSQLQVVHPRTKAIELDRLTMVVHIDGACRDNGKPTARAAWGVYFGPGSRHNAYGRLAQDVPQTSSRAEIEALSQALPIIREICTDNLGLQDIHIVSDSDYLVKSMAVYMEDWINSDGINSRGRPVEHFAKLKELHEEMDDMEYGDDGGMTVKFWHVPREKNRDADALANQAFD